MGTKRKDWLLVFCFLFLFLVKLVNFWREIFNVMIFFYVAVASAVSGVWKSA